MGRILWLLVGAVQVTAFAEGTDAVLEAPPFDILEFQVEGNSVLTAVAIETAVLPFLGEHRHLADAEAARVALEKVYQSAGYLTVFVDLPEQRVDQGVVRLTVAEGRVARLKVSGSRYFSQGYIRSKVPELADGKVPNFNEVQRELEVVNRTEDRRVQPVMRAGAEPGTVETELKVEDHLPLTGTVDLNNRHAVGTTPWRLNVQARYDNLFQRDHSVSVSAAVAPAAIDQSRVFSINYTIPNDDQSAWTLYAVNSNSNVAALGAVDVVGKGTTVGLRRTMPLLLNAEQSHTFTLGIDYKHVDEDTRSGEQSISTPLRYLPVSFGYAGSIAHSDQAVTQLNVQLLATFRPVLRRTVDCPGGTADQFACKRLNGDGGFATARADLRQSLGLGPGLLQLHVGGQVATGPVPSGEQYTIGGAETVRGYFEAEGAGDRGVLGSFEWHTPELAGAVGRWVGRTDALPGQLHALGFVDAGRAYVSDPATGQAPWQSLAGAGAGLRIALRKSVLGELDLAWPLKRTVATESHAPRLHLKLGFAL